MNNRQSAALIIGINVAILFGLIYKKSHAIGLQYKQQQLQQKVHELEQEGQMLRHRIDRVTNDSLIASKATKELNLGQLQLSQAQKIS